MTEVYLMIDILGILFKGIQHHLSQRLILFVNPLGLNVGTYIGFFIIELLVGCKILGWGFLIVLTLGFLTGDPFGGLDSGATFCGVFCIGCFSMILSVYYSSESLSLPIEKSESQSDYQSEPYESAHSTLTCDTSASSRSMSFTTLIFHVLSVRCYCRNLLNFPISSSLGLA
jgi:hypothetical protein